jgi:hypothetical protein
MADADVFRERARRRRELLKVAGVPEVIGQLKVWAPDFENDASKLDEELAAARRALYQPMKHR